MFSKVFIYGLTFGSAAAAIQFMFFSNALYQSVNHSIISLLILVVIYIVAIVLCIKSLVKDNQSLTIKKTMASGISVAVLVGVCMAVLSWAIQTFYPNIIDQLIAFQQSQRKIEFTPEDIGEIRKIFNFKMALPMFMSFSFSIGLMVSSAMVLVYQRRITK